MKIVVPSSADESIHPEPKDLLVKSIQALFDTLGTIGDPGSIDGAKPSSGQSLMKLWLLCWNLDRLQIPFAR
jgi:hypothetical protein